MNFDMYVVDQRHEQLVIVHRKCKDTVTIVEPDDEMSVLVLMCQRHDRDCK